MITKNQTIEELLAQVEKLGKEIEQYKKREKEFINSVKIKEKEIDTINLNNNRFLSIISHDLKAPLRSVISLVEWLSKEYKEKLDDKGNEYLSLIYSNTERMEHLINDILEYSRLLF